eukprot:CAMPEP_0119155638 /NCGR_PEP_ID=MMETSP1310-20130426/51848_1 /TAXON_ID=464262 /ORGANISM="Genus nov. species nov., Strain RCC2339" /LENGTH=985 /DNA_ID=CAMNT_0007148239 /DNA_START=292 /DNA_END=3250 /DNA_ORIENTATION=+
MGFPSEDSERFYRNPYSEVIRFLHLYHKDKFKVYNLCSERGYDPIKFENRCAVFPFDDHNPPVFELIEDMCVDVEEFLKEDPENVAVIHCKAGKGRTGCIICCWLLWNKEWPDADSSMQYYAAMRTKNQKGVTIPSQIRYIRYFQERLELDKWAPEYKTLYLSKIVMTGVPKLSSNAELKMTLMTQEKVTTSPWIPTQAEKDEFKKCLKAQSKKGAPLPQYVINCNDAPVIRDIKVIFDEKKMTSQEVVCTFWFNTWFIKDGYMKMVQTEIDKVNKDKKNERVPKDFTIEVYFKTDLNEEVDVGPSSGGKKEKEEEEPPAPVSEDALNTRTGPWTKEAGKPVEVAERLLKQATGMYIDALPKKTHWLSSRFSPTRNGDAKEVCQKLDKATGELQVVSLAGLSEAELTVFWLNVANLMYLHAFTTYGPSNSPAQREKMMEKAAYNIGGLLFPLVVVEHHIIRGAFRSVPSRLGPVSLPKQKVKEKDPRKAYALKSPSPLVNFGVCHGSKGSAPLSVYSVDTLEAQLEDQARVLLHTATKSEDGSGLVLPAAVEWFLRDFGKTDADVAGTLQPFTPVEGKPLVSLEFEEPDWEFAYYLKHLVTGSSVAECFFGDLREQQEDEKARKKEEMLAIMDEIDEVEEVAATEEENRRKQSKKKLKRSTSSKQSKKALKRKKSEKDSTKVSKESSEAKSSEAMVGSGEAKEESSGATVAQGKCEVCSVTSIVFCRTCEVGLCEDHLKSEHSSIVLRKHKLIRFDEGSSAAVAAPEEAHEAADESENDDDAKSEEPTSEDEAEPAAGASEGEGANGVDAEAACPDEEEDAVEVAGEGGEKKDGASAAGAGAAGSGGSNSVIGHADGNSNSAEDDEDARRARRREMAAKAIEKRRSGDPRARKNQPQAGGRPQTEQPNAAKDVQTASEAGEVFGVQLSKRDGSKAEDPVEEEPRQRLDTMDSLKPENVGKKWGVSLRKNNSAEAGGEANGTGEAE